MVQKARKKTAAKVKFQLSKSGIAGIAVVCFCIFLWMFLLGVWAGQSLLFRAVENETRSTTVLEHSSVKTLTQPVTLEADKHKKKK